MTLSSYKLKKKILSDRYNSIIFEKGSGREIYLVGGYIRDILRGMESPDRDYIVNGDIRTFVKEIKEIIGGTIVEFKKGDMIRVALKDGLTFDFSKPVGTLKEDLSKRDFTINSIAWSPEIGFIDFYNGFEDIRKDKISNISKENFISDPLRMLRAYRFAAELNGSIDKRTRETIKLLHNNIKEASSERITLELFNLLNSDYSARHLKTALLDGLLTSILSFPYKTLERNIKVISLLEKATIIKLPYKIKVILKKIFSQNLTYKGLLCLELLLQNGFAHKKTEPNIKVSTIISKRVELTHGGIKRLKLKDRLFDVFTSSKEASMDVLILINRLDLFKVYMRFRKILKKGILSSEDIVSILNIKDGPILGWVIKELRRAEFEGRVKSKSSAIKFIKSLQI